MTQTNTAMPHKCRQKADNRAKSCIDSGVAKQWLKPLEGSQMELMDGTGSRQGMRKDSWSRGDMCRDLISEEGCGGTT